MNMKLLKIFFYSVIICGIAACGGGGGGSSSSTDDTKKVSANADRKAAENLASEIYSLAYEISGCSISISRWEDSPPYGGKISCNMVNHYTILKTVDQAESIESKISSLLQMKDIGSLYDWSLSVRYLVNVITRQFVDYRNKGKIDDANTELFLKDTGCKIQTKNGRAVAECEDGLLDKVGKAYEKYFPRGYPTPGKLYTSDSDTRWAYLSEYYPAGVTFQLVVNQIAEQIKTAKKDEFVIKEKIGSEIKYTGISIFTSSLQYDCHVSPIICSLTFSEFKEMVAQLKYLTENGQQIVQQLHDSSVGSSSYTYLWHKDEFYVNPDLSTRYRVSSKSSFIDAIKIDAFVKLKSAANQCILAAEELQKNLGIELKVGGSGNTVFESVEDIDAIAAQIGYIESNSSKLIAIKDDLVKKNISMRVSVFTGWKDSKGNKLIESVEPLYNASPKMLEFWVTNFPTSSKSDWESIVQTMRYKADVCLADYTNCK